MNRGYEESALYITFMPDAFTQHDLWMLYQLSYINTTLHYAQEHYNT